MGSKLIQGVQIAPLSIVQHPQGNIMHALKSTSCGFCGFGESYFSFVHKGEIKGWKKHKRFTLNLVVPVGGIRFVAHDDRHHSSTKGNFFDVTLGVGFQYSRLTIPPGVWVSFQGIEDLNMLMNIIPEEHDPTESENVALNTISYTWM